MGGMVFRPAIIAVTKLMPPTHFVRWKYARRKIEMDTFLPPIERPKGIVKKLAYYFTRRQFGKVLTPLKVHSARLPAATAIRTIRGPARSICRLARMGSARVRAPSLTSLSMPSSDKEHFGAAITAAGPIPCTSNLSAAKTGELKWLQNIPRKRSTAICRS